MLSTSTVALCYTSSHPKMCTPTVVFGFFFHLWRTSFVPSIPPLLFGWGKKEEEKRPLKKKKKKEGRTRRKSFVLDMEA